MTAPLAGVRAVVVGGGFAGLSAAYELAKRSASVTVLERDGEIGGLAGSFDVGGQKLEKFYHHWFTNDQHVMRLIEELRLQPNVLSQPTRTGTYYANRIFRLSSPLDVFRYTPLSLLGRIRLGLLVFQAKMVRDWRALEDETAEAWLRRHCGTEVYETVWQPLLHGKFGSFAEEISAVWFWSKLVLRGGSRGKTGKEVLAYYRGGFAALADAVAGEIARRGGTIRLASPATGFQVEAGRVTGVRTADGVVPADIVVHTTALPIFADLVAEHVRPDYLETLRRIRYLGNVCLTLALDRSLSDTYWLNVADPDFPFVGVIEHTNFEPPSTYEGRHLVYLSKYLPTSDPLYRMSKDEVFEFALPHIQRMFPKFQRDWVRGYHVYRAEYSQPIVTLRYSELIPDMRTPIDGLFLATMAQIYPEDRGTNYAIRQGADVAKLIENLRPHMPEAETAAPDLPAVGWVEAPIGEAAR